MYMIGHQNKSLRSKAMGSASTYHLSVFQVADIPIKYLTGYLATATFTKVALTYYSSSIYQLFSADQCIKGKNWPENFEEVYWAIYPLIRQSKRNIFLFKNSFLNYQFLIKIILASLKICPLFITVFKNLPKSQTFTGYLLEIQLDK